MEERLLNFLKAQDKLFEDFSDGAYLNALQDSVDLFNEDNRTEHIPYDTMMEYIKLTSEKQ